MRFFQLFLSFLWFFVVYSQTTLCPTNISVCLNGGSCVIINQRDMQCKCLTGYTGVFCENSIMTTIITTTQTTTTTTTSTSVSLCPSSVQYICQNQGICYIFNGKEMTCKCSTGFAGNYN